MQFIAVEGGESSHLIINILNGSLRTLSLFYPPVVGGWRYGNGDGPVITKANKNKIIQVMILQSLRDISVSSLLTDGSFALIVWDYLLQFCNFTPN